MQNAVKVLSIIVTAGYKTVLTPLQRSVTYIIYARIPPTTPLNHSVIIFQYPKNFNKNFIF